MSVLHHLQDVTVEINLALKVGIVEDLHRHLEGVLLLERDILDSNVSVQSSTGQDALFVDSWTDVAHQRPVADGNGNTEQGNQEKVPCPAVGQSEDPGKEGLQDPGEEQDAESELDVAECGGTFSGELGVGDSRVVGQPAI